MTTTTETAARDYTASLDLPASATDIAALFSSADGVSRWWGPTEGDATVGGTLITRFGDAGVNANRVREAGPLHFVWEPVAVPGTTPTAHTKEWLGTAIEIDIESTQAGSTVHFRHRGLTPQMECWNDCFAGWTHFMASIESYATTGVGTPFGA